MKASKNHLPSPLLPKQPPILYLFVGEDKNELVKNLQAEQVLKHSEFRNIGDVRLAIVASSPAEFKSRQFQIKKG